MLHVHAHVHAHVGVQTRGYCACTCGGADPGLRVLGKVVTKYPPLTYYSYMWGAAWGPRIEGAAVKGVTKYRLTA